jgi:hypothetical protein
MKNLRQNSVSISACCKFRFVLVVLNTQAIQPVETWRESFEVVNWLGIWV